MQTFLIKLALAILESYLVKGSKAFDHYLELKSELLENKKKAIKYDQVVKNPNASREERKKIEDDLLS